MAGFDSNISGGVIKGAKELAKVAENIYSEVMSSAGTIDKAAEKIEESTEDMTKRITDAFKKTLKKINNLDFKIDGVEVDTSEFAKSVQRASVQIKRDIEGFDEEINDYVKNIIEKKRNLSKNNTIDISQLIIGDISLDSKQSNRINNVLSRLNTEDENLKKELEKQLINREKLIEEYNKKQNKMKLSDGGIKMRNERHLNNATEVYEIGTYIKQLENDINNQLAQNNLTINLGNSIQFDASSLKEQIENFADTLISDDSLNKIFSKIEDNINERYQNIFDVIKGNTHKIDWTLFKDVFSGEPNDNVIELSYEEIEKRFKKMKSKSYEGTKEDIFKEFYIDEDLSDIEKHTEALNELKSAKQRSLEEALRWQNEMAESMSIGNIDDVNRYRSYYIEEIENYKEYVSQIEFLRSQLDQSQNTGIGDIGISEETITALISALKNLNAEIVKIRETFGAIDDETGLPALLSSIEKINLSLQKMEDIFVNVGDGEEFSPLLKAINSIQSSVSELSKSMSGFKLNVNMGIGTEIDEKLNQQIAEKTSRQLEAYRKLFSAMKSTGYTNKEMLQFFEPEDVSPSELIGIYKSMIERAEKQFATVRNKNGEAIKSNVYKDVLGDNYKHEVQLARDAFNRVANKKMSGRPLEELFGKADFSDSAQQLNEITIKLKEFIDIVPTNLGLGQLFGDAEGISSKTSSIDVLKQKINDVTTAVDTKTNAFKEEEQVVSGSVQREITELEILDGQLNAIIQSLERIKNASISLDVKVSDDAISKDQQYIERKHKKIVAYKDAPKISSPIKVNNKAEISSIKAESEQMASFENVVQQVTDIAIEEQEKLNESINQNIEDAANAKNEFANANENVQDSVDESKAKLKTEAELMDDVANSAREAADAKRDFANANENVQDSVDRTSNSINNANDNSSSTHFNEDDDREAIRTNRGTAGDTTSYRVGRTGRVVETGTRNGEYFERELTDITQLEREAIKWTNKLALAQADLNKEWNKSQISADDSTVRESIENQIAYYQRMINTINDLARRFASEPDSPFSYADYENKIASETRTYATELATKEVKQLRVENEKERKLYEQIQDAYGKLASTEDRYLTLSAKQNLNIATDEQRLELEELARKREKAYNKTLEQTAVTQQETDAQQRYLDVLNQTNGVLDSYIRRQEEIRNVINNGTSVLDGFRNNPKNIAGFDEIFSHYEQKVNELNIKLQEHGNPTASIIEKYRKDIQNIQKELDSIVVGNVGKDNAKATMYNYARSLKDVEIGKFNEQTNSLNVKLREQDGILKEVVLRYNEITDAIQEISKTSIQDVQPETNGFFHYISTLATESGVLNGLIESLKSLMDLEDLTSLLEFTSLEEGIEIVKSFDTALTNMRKVSDESIDSLKEFQKASFDIGRSIGTTAEQLQSSTTDFIKLGYELSEAVNLAKDTNIYANVGEMDTEDATEHMISSIQAWKTEFSSDVEASNAIINRYNEIGNNFAITSAEIGEAMERSAAALKAGGNTLNESLGLIVSGNLIQQDVTTTAAALKILSLRIRGAKADLESMGESTDGMISSTSKLRAQIMALSGVDIMLNED